jgi:formylglycine-generating enzyme required for sulfatase activity
MSESTAELVQIAALPVADRAAALAKLASTWRGSPDVPVSALAPMLVDAVESGAGEREHRLILGLWLGEVGDPRVLTPEDADYWRRVDVDGVSVQVGQFPVTNFEFRRFVDAGGYDQPQVWSDEGAAWLRETNDPWPVRANAPDARPFLAPNQPVVAVSFHEAAAYARWAKARLLRFDERLAVVRGVEKRPYPWGSPFNAGCAATREEVLSHPVAVGLYVRDATPEGVRDLGGNVAEWAADGHAGSSWISPGAWNQPSMASWAKAREFFDRGTRSPALGLRLARDDG